MDKRQLLRQPVLAFAALMLASVCVSSVQAGPIGFVESNGIAYVYPAGSETRLNVNGSQAVFANDRIELASGSLVLNLNGGGSVAFSGPSAAILGAASERLDLELSHGAFTYSLPAGARNLNVRTSDAVISSRDLDPSEAGVIRSGAIERLSSGGLRTHARSGSLQVIDRDGTEHVLGAGQGISIDGAEIQSLSSDDAEADDTRRVEPAPRPRSIS
ncbi:MAG: hypothetical protein EA418_11875 [Wenzhouxiangellaceae bacterium]|nr:MAG: hypothetical protein EA418_11875 [Wenzhouxiangellaceae bacterium]